LPILSWHHGAVAQGITASDSLGGMKIGGRFLAIHPDPDNIRKVSRDLADGDRYAETFCISTLIRAICGNCLSNKIVMLPELIYKDGIWIVCQHSKLKYLNSVIEKLGIVA
jgi:hypothetical protein